MQQRASARKPAAAPPQSPPSSRPERWCADVGDAALAALRVPPDARRERRFEVACAMTVRLPADVKTDARTASETGDAWHEMTVHVNGARQWSRRIGTSNPGHWDGLDYRFAATVPAGQALRVTVQVATRGALRRSLLVEADEL